MRYAVLVSVQIKADLRADILAGKAPRRDYLDICDALNAQLINSTYVPRRGGLIATGMVQAWNAFKRRDSYDVIISDSDHSGIALALLLKLTGTRKRHIMISHWLTPAKKVFFFRKLHVETHIDKVVTYSTNQERVALNVLKLPRGKVERVLHPADHHFWRPLQLPIEGMICSAGLEYRDYPTLIQAVEGLDLQLTIAAASPWSQRTNLAERVTLPQNVHVGKRSYFELRQIYATSEFVVVPVFDVDFQAGSLVMYEAMAMGKALIVTRTQAHRDGDILREGENGLFVPPGDVQAMREAICDLHRSPDKAKRLGLNGRRMVEEGLNHHSYVQRMVDITHDVAGITNSTPVGTLELGQQPY